MFDNLSEKLTRTLKKIRGEARITEENIRETLKEIRRALLEADVALPVVQEFLEEVKRRALGEEVQTSLTPGQAFLKIVHEELQRVMGEEASGLDLRTQPPAVILLAGLQGSGKTTTAAKLAKWLKEREKKKVAVVSCDVYRPAAIEQLRTLAEQVGVEFLPSSVGEDPVEIARRAVEEARRRFFDVLIVDSAGRLHIDEEMMREIRAIHEAIRPRETLFVVDSMTGQDAANTARAFHEALPLTGVILTKTDGDARGGAALSVRKITGAPIKFLGTGEKPDAFELFHPDRIASRILGMGDLLSLIEEIEQKVDKKRAEKVAKKLLKGKGFDLEDMREQLLQLKKMGGLQKMVEKLPGMNEVPKELRQKLDDKVIDRQIAIINSMTPQERRFPDIINKSRKARIARGCGLTVREVNALLKQYQQMQKMMKRMRRLAGLGRIPGLGKFPGMPKMPF